MDDVITHVSLLLSAFTFAAFFFGLLVFRHDAMLRTFYRMLLLGYVVIYSLDIGAMIYDTFKEPWYIYSRQLLARLVIATSHWVLILSCLSLAANGRGSKWSLFWRTFWNIPPEDPPHGRGQP